MSAESKHAEEPEDFAQALAQGINSLKEQLAAKDAEIAELKRKLDDLIPSECPITKEPYFTLIQDERGIWQPTFGGPYDSYTIPVRDGEDLDRRRYDHDGGAWKDGCESINLKVIEEDKLVELQCNSDDLATLRAENERLKRGQDESEKQLRHWQDQVSAQYDDVLKLTAENTTLRQQVERLRDALKTYGHHTHKCLNSYEGQNEWQCTCGLDAALAEKGAGE